MFVLFLHCFVTRRCVLTQIRHSNVVSLTSLKKKTERDRATDSENGFTKKT